MAQVPLGENPAYWWAGDDGAFGVATFLKA